MSSQEENSQDVSESKQIERLHMIWKDMKDGKRGSAENRLSDKKSLLSVKDAIHREQQKNLEARLHMTQNQLAKARENTALLMKKLSEAEEQIENLREQLDEERRALDEKDQKLEELSSQLTNLIKQQHVYQHHSRSKHNTFGPQPPAVAVTSPLVSPNAAKDARTIAQLQQQIQQLREDLEFKSQELEKALLKGKSADLEIQKLQLQIDRLLQENEGLRKKLEQAAHSLNQAYLQQQSKGAQLLQIDELNRTIQRLVQLLKRTEEYREFALFAEDSDSIHFLKHVPKRLKTNNINTGSVKLVRACTCMEIKIDERLIWSPATTYKFMLQMKLKYETLSEPCIQQILYGLNRLSLSRESNHVKRVSDAYEAQIARLKKKTDERYDQMVARKQIQRLKKDLSKARNKESPAALTTLKAAGQYEDEIRLKEREIRLLHERLKLLESEAGGYDKAIYMEGALWVLSKVVREVEEARGSLGQFEEYFVQTLQNILGQEAKSTRLMRAYKAFFENVEEVFGRVYQKVLMMQESTRRKLTQQKSN